MNPKAPTQPVTNLLTGEKLKGIPPVRRLRNAMIQDGVQAKIAALISPRTPVYNQQTTVGLLANQPGEIQELSLQKRVLQVVTEVSTFEQLLELINANDIVIIHANTLPGKKNEGFLPKTPKSIKKLQKMGYQVSFSARYKRETGYFIIEQTPETYTLNKTSH